MDNQNIIIQKVIKQGNDNCKHEWIKQSKGYSLTSFPSKYPYERICKKCGRLEDVLITEQLHVSEFNQVFTEFYEAPTNSNLNQNTYNPCEKCSNRPKNGEMKICHCTLATRTIY